MRQLESKCQLTFMQTYVERSGPYSECPSRQLLITIWHHEMSREVFGDYSVHEPRSGSSMDWQTGIPAIYRLPAV